MNDLLRLLLGKKGSDLFVTAGFPPAIKVDGRVTPVNAMSRFAEARARSLCGPS